MAHSIYVYIYIYKTYTVYKWQKTPLSGQRLTRTRKLLFFLCTVKKALPGSMEVERPGLLDNYDKLKMVTRYWHIL